MTLNPKIKKEKIRFILIVVFITLIATFIIFLLVRTLSDKGALHNSEITEMNKKIKSLNKKLESLNSEYSILNRDRDSLKNHVDYMIPLRSLIYNAKLRDQVGINLDLCPGDIAMMKTDSSRVVIIDLKVGGNDLSYYVNYLIKTNNGSTKEVSPYELSPLKK